MFVKAKQAILKVYPTEIKICSLSLSTEQLLSDHTRNYVWVNRDEVFTPEQLEIRQAENSLSAFSAALFD